MSHARRIALLALLALPTLAAPPHRQLVDDDADWRFYGGDAGGSRYADLKQIDRRNVDQLQIAWTYRSGELGAGFARADKLSFEATPILANGSLYLSTPTNIVIALDPATGRERWRYDPKIPRDLHYSEATSRGVSWWVDTQLESTAPCATRIFIGTLDARLIAVDGASGRPCAGFGVDGVVDLGAGVRLVERGDYLVTSPPAIYRDLVITGSAIGDNRGVELERGVVRAFDARTGALRWSWDPIPIAEANDLATRGWTASAAQRTGAANAWSIFSVDAGRDLVFIPTGSASPDFFGGERAGDNRYANSLVALRASTGQLVWHRQLVHHDLWDYDLAAQPLLVDIEREGKSIAAVIQATKTGMLFVFDRETGEPVFEIVERAVPASDVPGEAASPTQPFPATPALVSHAAVTPQDAWGLTFYDRGRCRELIENHRSEGIFTPPSLRGTIMSPGYAGGVNWGSLAFDSERQLVLAAVINVPMVVTLVPRDDFDTARKSGQWPDSEFARQAGTAYGMRREALMSPLGLPCTPPPWGTLAAVDLRRNTIRWQVMLGSTRDKTPWFVPSATLGMPNMGGPIATAGGLAFIGAATDNYLRAFDLETGQELWKGRLPAGGQATPMTYEMNGRQFVVIAAGGHGGLDTTRGDYVVAFALPQK
ncbi:MAG TPA: pyrroloquinoline quinone-dependent dehydrogenase [Povalibacter sp.]|uniref:pyrroloquinoline quinone-dependent dehydrogenase n=1 Tax=Povalibacter sp. TaxID=1962978 RepID=UPI002C988F7E|nr:pyrroloquinoline quinone-dependent dehydrogenase [Povalibacter sp.]HMN45042.1 pyrroloquinoline quinone-dependent dehydrogenase [Povalibacter sp.]